jgi:hypothetical protein
MNNTDKNLDLGPVSDGETEYEEKIRIKKSKIYLKKIKEESKHQNITSNGCAKITEVILNEMLENSRFKTKFEDGTFKINRESTHRICININNVVNIFILMAHDRIGNCSSIDDVYLTNDTEFEGNPKTVEVYVKILNLVDDHFYDNIGYNDDRPTFTRQNALKEKGFSSLFDEVERIYGIFYPKFSL